MAVTMWETLLYLGIPVAVIVLTKVGSGVVVFCWRKDKKIKHTSLPQKEIQPWKEERKTQLDAKRKCYVLAEKFPPHFSNGPIQVKDAPREEDFPLSFKVSFLFLKIKLKIASAVLRCFTGRWKELKDRFNVYPCWAFPKPLKADLWNDDLNFAMQRVASQNNSVIELMTSIPKKLPVTDKLLRPFLQGLTLSEAIKQKRLFICDLEILNGLPVREKFTLCAPIGLFFVDDINRLKPVAIQLFQEPGPNNPIFTPTCNEWTWRIVKMWYNNADAAYHEALTHLGFSHLLMESFALASERNLSESHPVFKLLQPHFLDLMSINSFALTQLVSDGGWIDKTMNFGNKGLYQVIIKRLETWRFDIEGTLPEDLRRRGLDDPSVLLCYYYREDAILLYNAINNYVRDYLKLYYLTATDVTEDYEIQHFAQELVKERNQDKGGMGIKGLPGNGSLSNIDQLQQICTNVIYICSAGHAATNFPQYDEYGFPPNWPLTLFGKPPTDPDVLLTEKDVHGCLPDKYVTLEIMTITRILSNKATQSLGDFETQYIYDSEAVEVVDRFRQELLNIGDIIEARNKQRENPYVYLNPVYIPNSISI